MRRVLLVGLALIGTLLLVSAVEAQTLTGYQLGIYMQGGVSPITVYELPMAGIQCGQPKVAVSGPVQNPSYARWDDPASATLDCVWVDTGSGPLFALPFNPTQVYEAAIRAVNAAGVSGESPRSNPFTRPGQVPSAPAGLRIGG